MVRGLQGLHLQQRVLQGSPMVPCNQANRRKSQHPFLGAARHWQKKNSNGHHYGKKGIFLEKKRTFQPLSGKAQDQDEQRLLPFAGLVESAAKKKSFFCLLLDPFSVVYGEAASLSLGLALLEVENRRLPLDTTNE